jgi:hypothetical protein
MRPRASGRILGGLVGFLALGAGIGLQAGDGPSDAELAKLGLKRSGPLLVLEAESEVHNKAEEVRHSSRQVANAVARQRLTLSPEEYQAALRELNAELAQFKAQLNSTTQAINRMPRRRGYPVYIEQFQELTYFKSQLQAEISQRSTFLNQLKGQKFDPTARTKADADVRSRREELHQGVQDLRKLVDALHEKYAAVAKEPKVQKWLDTPEGSAGIKPKLGPSHVFRMDVKMLEQMERAQGGESGSATRKAAHKGRRTKAARRPANPDGDASPF